MGLFYTMIGYLSSHAMRYSLHFILSSLMLLVVVSCLDDTVSSSYQESIPKCPTPFESFPCICSKTSLESPLDVFCATGNLASISLPFAVYFAKQSLPLRNLRIRDANFSALTGPLFQGLNNVSSLFIESCSMQSVSSEVLTPLKTSLQILSLKYNQLESIPTESLKVLNLSHFDVSNNLIGSLSSTSFPKSLSSLMSLNVSHNQISRIESSSFTPLVSSLEDLDLSHNQVSKLERNTFKGMKKLKLLDLSFNNFSSFDRSDFVELLGLQVIRLTGMSRNLTKLPQSIFTRNAQLQSIDVSDNVFTEVDAYITRGVRFLRKFLASGNQINSIAKRAFSTNTRIRVIDLSRNLLTNIPSEMFTGLQYLELLDLSRNLIKTLDPGAFQSIFKIDINLSYNQLDFIPRSSFIECSNISLLDLSHNNLSRIHAEAFLDSDVTQLVLNHNKFTNLTEVPIGNLTGIRFLNMSYNEIVSVNRKSFGLKQNTKLYEAAVVDLSFNHLKELSGSMFDKFWALRHLNLSNNQFKRLGFGSFGNLPTLLDLNLDNNQLKDIGSINGLISLKSLYVRNNSLKSIPTLSVALNELYLEDNEIDSISCSSFPMINSLLSLHLRNNSISSIDSDSFCNLLTLREVDLSFNKIPDVEQVTPSLQKLSSLQSLDLSFNSIPVINSSNAFGNLPTLFSLNLSGNNITHVSPFAFNGLLQLLSLNLSHNLMSNIEYDSLKGLVSLQSLDLSFNTLTRIENRTNSFFEDLLSLESLYLAGNRLSFLTPKSLPSSQWVPYKIRFLDLSYNHLESISTATGFAEMQTLLLHHNHIRSLIPGVFGNMSSLQSLDLSFNRLTHIPLHAFSFNVSSPKDVFTLRFLNLSHNDIQSIDSGELTRISSPSLSSSLRSHSSPSSQSLDSVDLSFNRLSTSWPEVDVSILVGRGVSVRLTANPLPCTCKSRLQLDAVRRSIQRISPRLSKFLTFNHDVNTYNSQENVLLNFTSTAFVMNDARNEWDSLTCPSETLLQTRKSSRRRNRNRRPREMGEDSVTGNPVTVTTQEPNHLLVLPQLSSQELSCSEQEALSLLEGDALIRGISWIRSRRNSLKIVWFIRNEVDDVANFQIERNEVDPDSDSTSESLEVSYLDREYIFHDINPRKSHRVCLKTYDSAGKFRPVYPSSCVTSSPKPK
jgi:Leucine-rich repeat (LRR) protein